MSPRSIGFIGGGRVTRFMLDGWARSGVLPASIVIGDPSSEVRALAQQRFPAVRVDAGNLAPAAQDLVFLAVHPPAIGEALTGIQGGLRPDTIVVSLAPKATLARLQVGLAGFGRLARCIPNAPSMVGQGLNPVAFGQELPAPERDAVLGLLRPLGACPEVPEAHLEAYAILAAMGPTYLWPQLYELTDLGLAFGLDRPTALAAVAAMVEGTARTMVDSGLDEPAVLDLVPVHPLREQAATWRQQYREVLAALHAKLRP